MHTHMVTDMLEVETQQSLLKRNDTMSWKQNKAAEQCAFLSRHRIYILSHTSTDQSLASVNVISLEQHTLNEI
jgi:hypothetical protein